MSTAAGGAAAGGVTGSIDIMRQLAKKVLTGSDEDIDLNTKAQLLDNAAREAQNASRGVLAQGALGEQRSWLYDAGLMAADELIEGVEKLATGGGVLSESSSFVGYFKDAKERGDSDEEAFWAAITACGLEKSLDESKKWY